jgi:hypothetical protein
VVYSICVTYLRALGGYSPNATFGHYIGMLLNSRLHNLEAYCSHDASCPAIINVIIIVIVITIIIIIIVIQTLYVVIIIIPVVVIIINLLMPVN